MAVIKDVAKLAGVSISTVSKYFNNPSGLSEPYRSCVERAVAELNYTPNEMARGLRTKKTKNLALIVPDILNIFYTEIYSNIRSAAMLSGYTIQLYTSDENVHILSHLLHLFSRSNIDGIIICFLDEDTLISELDEVDSNTPISLISWNVNTHFNSVILDLEATIYEATKYLIGKGLRDIAYIGGTEHSQISERKFLGFQRAMQEAGLIIRDEFLDEGNYLIKVGYQAAEKFMHQSSCPTGIVCANDVLAIGCCKYLINHGYSIPGDVAVIGMDGIQLSLIFEPSITTVAMPIESMCREVVDLLINKIEFPTSKNRQSIYTPKLRIGRSTDADAPIYLDF